MKLGSELTFDLMEEIGIDRLGYEVRPKRNRIASQTLEELITKG